MIHLLDQTFVLKQPSSLTEEDLNPANLNHLKALRPDKGERIAFIDLQGKAVHYVVDDIRPLVLHFEKIVETAPIEVKTALYLCPPIGSALDQAIEQATEVGYDEIYFVRSERVQFPKQKEMGFARLGRIAHASCMQSGRLWAPVIQQTWLTLEEALEKTKDSVAVCADEGVAQKSWGISHKNNPIAIKSSVAIFIGPEGGWSPAERERLHNETKIFSLGPHVLRVPTAVVAAYVLTWKELS